MAPAVKITAGAATNKLDAKTKRSKCIEARKTEATTIKKRPKTVKSTFEANNTFRRSEEPESRSYSPIFLQIFESKIHQINKNVDASSAVCRLKILGAVIIETKEQNKACRRNVDLFCETTRALSDSFVFKFYFFNKLFFF